MDQIKPIISISKTNLTTKFAILVQYTHNSRVTYKQKTIVRAAYRYKYSHQDMNTLKSHGDIRIFGHEGSTMNSSYNIKLISNRFLHIYTPREWFVGPKKKAHAGEV